MEKNLDQVRTELAQIHDELLELPADDFERRVELQDRQNELRQLSRKLIENEPVHNRAALEAAYSRLEEVRDHLLDRHVSPFYTTSVGDAGIESSFTDAVNKAMDAGDGLDEVEARLKKILDEMRNSS